MIIGNKTTGHESTKPGSGRQVSVLLRTSELAYPEVCGKFRNSRPHRHLHVKKPQVEALSLTRVLGISDICRIPPDTALDKDLIARGD